MTLKCLEIIVNSQRIKNVNENEKLLDSYWKCLMTILENDYPKIVIGIFKKLNEINQRWLLGKLIESFKKGEMMILILKYSTDIKLKVIL